MSPEFRPGPKGAAAAAKWKESGEFPGLKVLLASQVESTFLL